MSIHKALSKFIYTGAAEAAENITFSSPRPPRLLCRKILILLTVLSSINAPLLADDVTEVVVSATRIETPRKKVGSSITVITAKEMDQRQDKTVAEAIETVAGLDKIQTGGLGSNTSVFMRGANSEHTLVLIDGIEANNPISPTRAFNFADMSTDNIERIEILRGPQSTLYGSDAMGGVINIITKKGKGAPKVKVSSEAGSYDTYIEQGDLSGGGEMFDFSLGASRTDSNGISSAGAKYGNNEDDSYDNTSFSARVGVKPSEILGANLFARYNDGRSNIDNSGGVGGDDPNRLLENEQGFVRGEINLDLFEKRLAQKYGISYSDQEFSDNNDPDILNPLDILRSDYSGSLLKLDLQNSYKLNDAITFLFGVETEEEKGNSHFFSDGAFGPFESDFPEESERTDGYYGETHLGFADSFFSTLGLRADHHSVFGSEVTWRVAPTYLIKSTDTKLSTSVGTGYKTPSLFQLYSSFGSRDLEPEESIGVDAGVEQKVLENALVGVTFFWNKFDDLISFDPNTFLFENISEAKTKGLEIFGEFDLTEELGAGVNVTLLDTEDESTGDDLLRRADNKVGAFVNYQFIEGGNVRVDLLQVGNREDNNFSTFPASRVELGSYAVVNVAATYEVNEHLELFARVDNLFDKEYEEVYGFGTLGVAGYGGIRVKL